MFAFFHVVSGSFRLRLSNDLSFPMNGATDRATDWYTSSFLLLFLRGPSSLDFLPPVSSLSFALSLSHFDLHVPCPFLFVTLRAADYVKTMNQSNCVLSLHVPIHVQLLSKHLTSSRSFCMHGLCPSSCLCQQRQ